MRGVTVSVFNGGAPLPSLCVNAPGPFPMTTNYRWEPTGSAATTMSIRNHGQPTGFSRLATPLLSIAMRRAMRGDLRTLEEDPGGMTPTTWPTSGPEPSSVCSLSAWAGGQALRRW